MLFFQLNSLPIIAQFFPQAKAGCLHPRHLCRTGPQPRHSGWRQGGGHQGGQQQVRSSLHPRVPRRQQAGCEGRLRMWWAVYGPEDTADTAETGAAHRWRFGNNLNIDYCFASPFWHLCYHAGRFSQGSGGSLKTKRREASDFLQQLRWQNQASAGKCKTSWMEVCRHLYFPPSYHEGKYTTAKMETVDLNSGGYMQLAPVP